MRRTPGSTRGPLSEARIPHIHRWTANDVLIWDDLCTIHNAWPDYGPTEHRLIKRSQVMADRVLDASFAGQAKLAA